MNTRFSPSFAAIAAGLFATLVAAAVIVFLYRSTIEDQTAIARNLARSIASTVEGQVANIDYVLQVSVDEIERQSATKQASYESVTSFLSRQQARMPQIDLLRATNPEGETIYGRGVDPAQRASLAQRDYYKQLRSDPNLGMVIAEPIVGKISQKPIWLMARRLNGPGGSFTGLAYASLFIDDLVNDFEKYHLTAGSVISLRDSNMRVVARTTFDASPALSLGDSRLSKELQQALSTNPREGVYESGPSTPDGISRIYAYQRSDKYGFILLTGITKSHVTGIWLKQSSIVVALLLTILIALGLVTRIISRKIDDELEKQSLAIREEERLLLKSLIHTVPYMIWLKNTEGVYLACNPEFERFFGHPENEIVGKTDYDFVPKDLAEFFLEHDRAAMAAGKPTVNEEWITYANDRHRALLVTTKTPMRVADGKVTGVLGIAHDIAELRANQKELERHRNQLERLVDERTAELLAAHQKVLDTQFAMDKVGIGITWVDTLTGRFLYVNDFHASTLGYSPDEMLQMRVSDIDPAYPAAAFIQVVNEIRALGVIQLETTQRKKNGQLIAAEMTLYYHAESGETGARLISFMTDITRRKENENALLAAKQAAEAANDANSALVKQLEAANHRLAMSDQRLTAMFAMSQKAPELDETDLLRMGIDEAVCLTHSQIGYLHFVNDDQETIALKTWSTETLHVCTAAYDDHCPVSAAGVWADTLRHSRPVIHNDYQALEARKGYPEGHAHLVRHLGVPVIDGGKVRLLMGVGNKTTDYDESDVSQLQLISNDLWSIIVRRRTEMALAEARQAAEAANVAKSAFLANMSHEIRTPMNAIIGMSHIIRRTGISAEQGERLNKIESAGQHLLEIINDILDLSKIEAGKFALEETEVDLGSIVENVASILSHQAQSKNLEIIVDNQLAERKYLGDATRLQQGLLNYGSNALKFTEQGTIILRVLLLEGYSGSALVRFEVVDQGIGIEADKLSKLFSAFEQADNTTSRKYGGTGLGLAITKKLAQLMGGDAGATSQPGEGSLFWFTARLKLLASHTSVPVPVPGMPAEMLLARDFPNARLLLVEDEPVNREVAMILLNGIWPSVDVAEDGQQAVQAAEASEYDLIFMDMQMPVMNGLEATRRIRQQSRGNAIPIIAMTANAFAEDRQLCFAAGMNDFLSKPVAPEALFEMILKWLRK